MIVIWGAWDAATSKEDSANELLLVGIFAVIGGLCWPVLVPLVLVAAIVGASYQLIRKFKCRKVNSK